MRRVLPLILALTAVAARSRRRIRGQAGRDAEPGRVLDAAAGARQAHRRVQGDAAGRRDQHRPRTGVIGPGPGSRNGLPADGVILNTGNDINNLVDKGLINKNWDKQSYNGVVWHSVVVYGLRSGNPKKVKGWNDLLKSGVQVVTVNPFTGGIAKWNILAAYVAQRRLGKTDKQAIAYLETFYKNNVVSQDSSGSNATNTFLSGKGDVLLTFESEAINGKIPFVIPRQTMLIDIYIAGLQNSQHKTEWNAFSRYLKTYPAQKILAENGYRPWTRKRSRRPGKVPGRPARRRSRVLARRVRVPTRSRFDPSNSVMQSIEESLGVPTS